MHRPLISKFVGRNLELLNWCCTIYVYNYLCKLLSLSTNKRTIKWKSREGEIECDSIASHKVFYAWYWQHLQWIAVDLNQAYTPVLSLRFQIEGRAGSMQFFDHRIQKLCFRTNNIQRSCCKGENGFQILGLNIYMAKTAVLILVILRRWLRVILIPRSLKAVHCPSFPT